MAKLGTRLPVMVPAFQAGSLGRLDDGVRGESGRTAHEVFAT